MYFLKQKRSPAQLVKYRPVHTPTSCIPLPTYNIHTSFASSTNSNILFSTLSDTLAATGIWHPFPACYYSYPLTISPPSGSPIHWIRLLPITEILCFACRVCLSLHQSSDSHTFRLPCYCAFSVPHLFFKVFRGVLSLVLLGQFSCIWEQNKFFL